MHSFSTFAVVQTQFYETGPKVLTCTHSKYTVLHLHYPHKYLLF